MTPGAEFNTYADSVASARVFALTSANPRLTMPPVLKGHTKEQLPTYPEKFSRRLQLKLFPLGTSLRFPQNPPFYMVQSNSLTPPTDITEPHLLPASLFHTHTTAPGIANSPLATWTTLFLTATFKKNASLNPQQDLSKLGLQLHDPLTIWYALSAQNAKWDFKTEDLRVETSGQWTRGCIVADRRGRPVKEGVGSLEEEVVGDTGGWGDSRRGNRVSWCVGSPGTEVFAGELLDRVFGRV
tara:strand:+ start:12528 stop:13250 length:723 start_codon:yes stop_codon:yes gene_type:complete